MDLPFVSIFVPIYNGESYLERTLDSIINQTYPNFEVLLVDDSSTDSSIIIAQKIVDSDVRFQLFVKPNGGATANSWNFILPKIKGDFIFYSSQDDLFSPNLILELVKRQRETGAELVLPIMEYYFEGLNENRRIVGSGGDVKTVISGREAFLKSLQWEIHGFALRSIHLFHDEIFPEDAFDSDEFMIRKLMLKSSKVAFCDAVFYYRQDNNNAITKKESINWFFILNTQLRILELLTSNNFANHLILKKKYELISNYLFLKQKVKVFHFADNEEKIAVTDFLNSFKENLSNEFFRKTFLWNNLKLSFKLKLKKLFLKIN